MNAVEKVALLQETEMQMKALHTISIWKNIAIAVSTLGIAVLYAGIAGESNSIFLSILGVMLILGGLISGLLLNLGLRNGRKNVEKMLNLLSERECL